MSRRQGQVPGGQWRPRPPEPGRGFLWFISDITQGSADQGTGMRGTRNIKSFRSHAFGKYREAGEVNFNVFR